MCGGGAGVAYAARVPAIMSNPFPTGLNDGFNTTPRAPGRIRTGDPPIKSRLLYQLSYKGLRGFLSGHAH